MIGPTALPHDASDNATVEQPSVSIASLSCAHDELPALESGTYDDDKLPGLESTMLLVVLLVELPELAVVVVPVVTDSSSLSCSKTPSSRRCLASTHLPLAPKTMIPSSVSTGIELILGNKARTMSSVNQ